MRAAAIAVATAGLGIAGYLTAVHYGGGEPACFIAHGCAVVQRSSYAELAGVPVALLGLLGYATILGALLLEARTLAAGAAVTGALFSAWLTVVEVTRLHAICAWCVASAVCLVVLAVLCPLRLYRAG